VLTLARLLLWRSNLFTMPRTYLRRTVTGYPFPDVAINGFLIAELLLNLSPELHMIWTRIVNAQIRTPSAWTPFPSVSSLPVNYKPTKAVGAVPHVTSMHDSIMG
jgi:hypothetical protein